MPSAVTGYYRKPTKKIESAIINDTDLIPPNREYLVLTYAQMSATYMSGSGKNETLTMEAHDDIFTVERGNTGVRWNNKRKIQKYPIEEWDSIFASFIKQGWKLYDTEKREKKKIKGAAFGLNGVVYKELEDSYVAELVGKLTTYANQMVEQEFQKSITDVPDSAFEKAKNFLDDLARDYRDIDNKAFNMRLVELFSILPRRIDIMSKYLAAADATETDRAEIIEKERDRYDTLYTVLRGGNINLDGKETILEAFGLEIRRFNDEELAFVKKKLYGQADKLVGGWRVINKMTEKRFNAYCEKENLTEKSGIDYLFHGSRSENWWSIITNGLTINPVGVVTTGKMFGHGTYFAPDAIKSLGYTSRGGSKWANGNQLTGYMGIYKVATGKRYSPSSSDSSLNWAKLQQIAPGTHCTWCSRGGQIGLRMDEVIVYQDCQDTVWGILELSM